jgi:hypothetical protein
MDKSRSEIRPLDSAHDFQQSRWNRQCMSPPIHTSPSTSTNYSQHQLTPPPQYAIYQSSIDYTVAAYGPYAASATGGNDFARDFLAGIAALYSTPMYSNIGKSHPLSWASTILGVIAIFVTVPIFYFYRNGGKIRLNSKFASQIAEGKMGGGRRKSVGTSLAGLEKA